MQGDGSWEQLYRGNKEITPTISTMKPTDKKSLRQILEKVEGRAKATSVAEPFILEQPKKFSLPCKRNEH